MNSFLPAWVVFCLVTNSFADDDPVKYDGYQVWRTELHHGKDHTLIREMEENQYISVWSHLPQRTDFMLRSENRLKVHWLLQKQHLNHTVLILNVQRRIEETAPPASVHWDERALRNGHRMNWHTYPSLEVINEYLDALNDSYASIVTVSTAGHSVENRAVKMVRVSNGNPANIPILLTGGIHAREWLGITSALYILNNLVSEFDNQPDHMKNKDWYIMPLVNPDGYEYTKTDRLWRKNRRRLSKCVGVDINRNFQKAWHFPKVSDHNQCSITYAGRSPFSEPETAAVRDALNSIIKNSKKTPGAYVDFHNYGHAILYPWAFTKEKPRDYNQLVNTANKMVQGIYNTSKLTFRHGSPSELFYPASGISTDWVYSSGVKLSYTIEGRDLGKYGFLIPQDQIEIAGKEMLAAIRVLAKDLSTPTLRAQSFQEWL